MGVGAGAAPLVTGSASGATVTMATGRSGNQRVVSALAPSELEAANLVLWDSLMPRNKAAVIGKSCHDSDNHKSSYL